MREELAAARQKWVGLLMDGLWKIGWKLKCIKQTMYVPIARFEIVCKYGGGKAWEILSSVVMSGRQREDT